MPLSAQGGAQRTHRRKHQEAWQCPLTPGLLEPALAQLRGQHGQDFQGALATRALWALNWSGHWPEPLCPPPQCGQKDTCLSQLWGLTESQLGAWLRASMAQMEVQRLSMGGLVSVPLPTGIPETHRRLDC